MTTLGPDNGSIKVHTTREGLGARVAHDLTLEAARWSAEVTLDADDITRSSASATIDGPSLEVIEGRGGAIPLSDKDRADIRKNIAQKVLQLDRHPEITFRSTGVEAPSQDRLVVSGELTVAGTTRPARLELRRETGADSDHLSGRVTITQSQWGIKPFSAMLGALKVADNVDVEIDVRVPHEAGVRKG
jgi:polyisoprenoid-binding protein YceI